MMGTGKKPFLFKSQSLASNLESCGSMNWSKNEAARAVCTSVSIHKRMAAINIIREALFLRTFKGITLDADIYPCVNGS
jgi:hypothetical protein